jgi:hypothetical protein
LANWREESERSEDEREIKCGVRESCGKGEDVWCVEGGGWADADVFLGIARFGDGSGRRRWPMVRKECVEMIGRARREWVPYWNWNELGQDGRFRV